MSAPVIRRAVAADAEAIAAVHAGPLAYGMTLQPPYASAERWADVLTRNAVHDLFLVIEIQDEIVGSAGLTRTLNPRRAHVAAVGLAVRDDWHGKGIGSRLMEAMVHAADRWQNVQRLELTVYADNAPAIALYRKFGFLEEGRMRAYALKDGMFVDALAMARLHPSPAHVGQTQELA